MGRIIRLSIRQIYIYYRLRLCGWLKLFLYINWGQEWFFNTLILVTFLKPFWMETQFVLILTAWCKIVWKFAVRLLFIFLKLLVIRSSRYIQPLIKNRPFSKLLIKLGGIRPIPVRKSLKVKVNFTFFISFEHRSYTFLC